VIHLPLSSSARSTLSRPGAALTSSGKGWISTYFHCPTRLCYHYYMATAKQSQRQTGSRSPAPARKASASKNKSLSNLYARLEKTRPGSEESKRISQQIVDAIG